MPTMFVTWRVKYFTRVEYFTQVEYFTRVEYFPQVKKKYIGTTWEWKKYETVKNYAEHVRIVTYILYQLYITCFRIINYKLLILTFC